MLNNARSWQGVIEYPAIYPVLKTKDLSCTVADSYGEFHIFVHTVHFIEILTTEHQQYCTNLIYNTVVKGSS
jgi:hypothetical protein